MKNTLNLKSFAAGSLSALLAIGLYSFTFSRDIPPQDGGITLQQAQAYHGDYNTEGGDSIAGVLEAVQLDKATIEMINDVKAKAKSDGVRIYYGKNSDGETMNVIVGTDANGSDLTKRYMNVTTGAVNVCPTVCDSRSPINQQ